jgi:hypothetical protein
MMKSLVVGAADMVGGVVAVAAQGPVGALSWTAAEQVPIGGTAVGGGRAGINVIALDPLSVGGVVEGAPYTAEAVTEITQTLADGNRIEQRSTAAIARDSQGRTRREQHGIALGAFMAGGDQPIVTITDPATGVHMTLNYDLRVAFRSRPMPMDVLKAKIAEAREAPGTETRATRSVNVLSGSAPEAGERIARFETAPVDQIVIGDRFELPVPPPPPPPPLPGGEPTFGVRFEGAVSTEALAPRDFDGVRAEGTRTTMTIPAGAMGNVLPIEVTTERWYSPELQVVLMTRRVDPRFGETVYRLTNIDRSEPSPEIFKVPPDFKVEEIGPRISKQRPDQN